MSGGPPHSAADVVASKRSAPRRSPPASARAAATRVALIHLGNAGGLGTTRRVAVWQELLAAAGAKTVEVNLLGDHRRALPSPLHLLRSLDGSVTPESATWSHGRAERVLQAVAPDVAVFVTPRAFHPRLAAAVPRSVLDLQDLFSASYRGRATVDGRRLRAAAWRALAWTVERFERRDHEVITVTAGFSEARLTGATWVPNVVPVSSTAPVEDQADAPFDLLFFGKLSSLPNVDAVRSLAAAWPRLAEEVPHLSCLVAGADPTDEVRRLAQALGWQVEADFDDVQELCHRARIAVAPLRHANGIQNKVLEAAAAGLPQVLSPQALGGTAPGFPAVVVRTREAMVAGVRALLAEPRRRVQLAAEARAHVAEHYSVERWAPVVRALLEGGSAEGYSAAPIASASASPAAGAPTASSSTRT